VSFSAPGWAASNVCRKVGEICQSLGR